MENAFLLADGLTLSVIASQCHLSQGERFFGAVRFLTPSKSSPFGRAGKAAGFD